MNQILNDIQLEIQRFYEQNGIKYKTAESNEDTIVSFFTFLSKFITPTERRVHYSRELLKKIKSGALAGNAVEGLTTLGDAFTAGKNVNGFLSSRVNSARQPDFLLYTWNLYHLHLGGKFAENMAQMKNNRSDTQLLCIVLPADVYFVDVIPHPEKAENYFNLRSLEIIRNNRWMEHIGFSTSKDIVPGSLEPKLTKDSDIFQLYTSGINCAFEFQGDAYFPIGNSISTARTPMLATLRLQALKKTLSQCFKNTANHYKGFCLKLNDIKLSGVLLLETPSGKINEIILFQDNWAGLPANGPAV